MFAAALIAGGVWVYRKLDAVPKALNAAGAAIGGGLYEFFHPDPTGEKLFYVVNFSNGKHAIPSSTVDSAGRFTFRGVKFVMRDKKKPDGTLEHWAFAG